MPIFTYTAKDLQGTYHKGDIETVDERQAANLIRRKKLIVISIKEKTQSNVPLLSGFFDKVKFSDVVVMTRQLSTMVGSGLVLSEALDILEEQQEGKRFKLVLTNVSLDVKGGLDFASALEKYPDVFPAIYSKLVRAGQASGKLDTILLQLAENLEKEREFKSKVKGAMIYPIVVLTMMIGVMMIMVFFVMPKMLSLYKDSGIELPLITKVVIFIANIMIGYWWAGLLGGIGAFIAFRRFVSTPEGRLLFDRLILKLPVVGRIAKLVVLTTFTRTLALLTSSGISILDSIKIVKDVVGNRYYQDSLELSYQGVERGLTFSSQLLSLPVFPKVVGQMMKTGEETGKLDVILFKLADYFESETDNTLKNVTTLIEPIIIVVLGIGVAILVISVILPIYQLTTNIQ